MPVTQFLDYLETPYLDYAYLGEAAIASTGIQVTFVIEDDNPVGIQTETGTTHPTGLQTTFVIEDDNPVGVQTEFTIGDFEKPTGVQFLSEPSGVANTGIQFNSTGWVHALCGEGYLTGDYLSGAYMSPEGGYCVSGGFQTTFTIISEPATGIQFESGVSDFPHPLGMQTEFNIVDFLHPVGIQTEFTIEDDLAKGVQTQFIIEEERPLGIQTTFVIEDDAPTGFQFEAISIEATGFQFRAAIYSATAPRILCEFPSRGTVTNNWVSNSTETGFNVNSVNTDIVEEVWRSASGTITGVNLDCDTGLAQGVAVDTVAILNTNLTTSATVSLLGSNVSDYSVIERTIPLAPLSNGNMYHINQDIPFTQQRYWRISIDDPTNSNGHLQIGLVVFGQGEIIINECFTDQIQFEQRDFTKTVRTEGQTTVAISRSQKRRISLNFQSLLIGEGNYAKLRNVFETFRTTLKCLWIPTPDPVIHTTTDRYAVFAKLTNVPVEQHNNKGPDHIYVDLTIDLDESL